MDKDLYYAALPTVEDQITELYRRATVRREAMDADMAASHDISLERTDLVDPQNSAPQFGAVNNPTTLKKSHVEDLGTVIRNLIVIPQLTQGPTLPVLVEGSSPLQTRNTLHPSYANSSVPPCL